MKLLHCSRTNFVHNVKAHSNKNTCIKTSLPQIMESDGRKNTLQKLTIANSKNHRFFHYRRLLITWLRVHCTVVVKCYAILRCSKLPGIILLEWLLTPLPLKFHGNAVNYLLCLAAYEFNEESKYIYFLNIYCIYKSSQCSCSVQCWNGFFTVVLNTRSRAKREMNFWYSL